MIRRCMESDFETIYAIINEAAEANRGVIPADRWKEPYMPQDGLRHGSIDRPRRMGKNESACGTSA